MPIQKCGGENARVALDQEEYQKRYDALVARYDAAEARLNEVAGQIEKHSTRYKERALRKDAESTA